MSCYVVILTATGKRLLASCSKAYPRAMAVILCRREVSPVRLPGRRLSLGNHANRTDGGGML